MADENRELQQGMEDLRNAILGLDAATKNANVGLQAFGKKAKELPGDIAKGMAGFSKQVAAGDTSLKSMNAVVDVAANAVSGLAKTIPYVGEALSALAKGVAEGAKLVVDQLDQTAKAFNQISASGAAVSDGMTGLYRQFTTAGLSLQQFQKVVGQNAVALARFRGIAGDGAEDFSIAVGNLTQGTDNSLRKLGMSAEDISQTAGAFVTQQTRLGKSQSMTTDQLTAGTKQYAMELDQLSKVTGLSRDAIQKQQDAALSESKFRANYELAMQSGNEAQIRGAKAMMTLQTRLSTFGTGELGQGVRDLSAGVANTDAAAKLVRSTGGAAQDIMARLKSGSIDQDQAQTELIEAMKRHQKAQLQIESQVGGATGAFVDTATRQDAINALQEGAWEKAKKTQNGQINKTDDLTNATVKAQQNIERMNIEINKLAFTVMPAAARATEALTGAMKDMFKWINKELGKQDVDVEDQDEANWKQMDVGEKIESGLARGLEKAVGLVWDKGKNSLQSSRVENETEYLQKQGRPGVTAAQQAAPAGTPGSNQAGPPAPPGMGTGTGAPAGTPGSNQAGPPAPAPSAPKPAGGPNVDKSKEASAAGGLFKGKALDGLNPGLIDRLTQAVMAYGKPVTVTSTVRTLDEQQKAYDDYISGRSPYPAAKPGKSRHQNGNAVDLNRADADALAQGGFLSAFGLGRPVKGDPVHIQEVSAANGAVLSGPTSGYQPNLTMHGTEAIVPLNSPQAQSMGVNNGENTSIMVAQLEKLEEMVSVMKNQLSVSQKIMQHAS